jgi:hypothetical protein
MRAAAVAAAAAGCSRQALPVGVYAGPEGRWGARAGWAPAPAPTPGHSTRSAVACVWRDA